MGSDESHIGILLSLSEGESSLDLVGDTLLRILCERMSNEDGSLVVCRARVWRLRVSFGSKQGARSRLFVWWELVFCRSEEVRNCMNEDGVEEEVVGVLYWNNNMAMLRSNAEFRIVMP